MAGTGNNIFQLGGTYVALFDLADIGTQYTGFATYEVVGGGWALSGTGNESWIITAGAVAGILNGSSIIGNVTFDGSSAWLILGAHNQLSGDIKGASSGDSIDLAYQSFAAGDHAAWTQSGSIGTLSLVNGSGTTLDTLTLAGHYTSADFSVTSFIGTPRIEVVSDAALAAKNHVTMRDAALLVREIASSSSNSMSVSNGVATGANVFAGGEELDSSASVGAGGTLTVSSGGSDSGTSVIGDTMNVLSGGSASGTSVSNGGTMDVSSGGTASGVSVGSGGTLNVSAGGVVSALTINDPNDQNVNAQANILSGGTVDGDTKINGGALILDAGAVLEPQATLTIVNEGRLVLEQDAFKGTIKDFGGSDTLDLAKIKFIGQGPDATTATFANSVLEVAQGSHAVDLHLAGTYTTANFALASDGAHGTLVTFVPNASLTGHG